MSPEFDSCRHKSREVLILWAPNKKYFKPAIHEENESLNNVDKIYTPNDCNSILKYIEIKSAEDTNKEAPKVLNITIKEYSAAFVILTLKFFEVKFVEGQATNIKEAIVKIKVSKIWLKVVTEK